jgi:hypothetical protein
MLSLGKMCMKKLAAPPWLSIFGSHFLKEHIDFGKFFGKKIKVKKIGSKFKTGFLKICFKSFLRFLTLFV